MKGMVGGMSKSQEAQTSAFRFECSAYDAAIAAFRRNGVIIIEGIFSRERIRELLDHLRRDYPSYIGAGKPNDSFIVGGGRFTAPLCFTPPFDCADIIAHPVLSALLSSILTDTFVFEAVGIISSLPGAVDQHMHRDGGMLFAETGVDRIIPPSAVTVVVPLVDMDEVNGTTAFWPGSHRSNEPDDNAPFVAPSITTGSLALWDFRLFHRGLANCGRSARPLLYVTACRPFWIDHDNFKPGKNAKLLACQPALDRLDEQTRARFVRAELLPYDWLP